MSRVQRVLLLLIGLDSLLVVFLGTAAGEITGWSPAFRLFLQWALFHAFGLLYLAFMFYERPACAPGNR